MRRFVLSLESDELLSTALDRVEDTADVVWLSTRPTDVRCRQHDDLLAGIIEEFEGGRSPSVWISLEDADLADFVAVVPRLAQVAAITFLCGLGHKETIEPLPSSLGLDWVLWAPASMYLTRDELGAIGAFPVFVRPMPGLRGWRDGLLRTIRRRELQQRMNPALSLLLGPTPQL